MRKGPGRWVQQASWRALTWSLQICRGAPASGIAATGGRYLSNLAHSVGGSARTQLPRGAAHPGGVRQGGPAAAAPARWAPTWHQRTTRPLGSLMEGALQCTEHILYVCRRTSRLLNAMRKPRRLDAQATAVRLVEFHSTSQRQQLTGANAAVCKAVAKRSGSLASRPLDLPPACTRGLGRGRLIRSPFCPDGVFLAH